MHGVLKHFCNVASMTHISMAGFIASGEIHRGGRSSKPSSLEAFMKPPLKNFQGVSQKNRCQGAQLEHTHKPCTSGQLTGNIPVDRRRRTRHRITD